MGKHSSICLALLLCASLLGCAAGDTAPTVTGEVAPATLEGSQSIDGQPTPTQAVSPVTPSSAPIAPTPESEPFTLQPVTQGGPGDYMLIGSDWVYYDYDSSSLCATRLDAAQDEQPRQLNRGSNYFLPWREDVLYFGSYAQTSRGFITNPRTGESRMIDKKHAEFYIPFYTAGDYVYFSRNGQEHMQTDILRMHKQALEPEFLYTLEGFLIGVCGDQIITSDLRSIWAHDFETGANRRTLFAGAEGAMTNGGAQIAGNLLVQPITYYKDEEYSYENITGGALLLIDLHGTVRVAAEEVVDMIWFAPGMMLGRVFTKEYSANWMQRPDYLITQEGLYRVTGMEIAKKPASYKGGAVVFPGLMNTDLIPLESMTLYEPPVQAKTPAP